MAAEVHDPAAASAATESGLDSNHDLDTTTTATATTTAGADDGGQDSAFLSSLETFKIPERNQAPGILDRRKSVRPTAERSKSRTGAKGKGKISKLAKSEESNPGGEKDKKPDIQVSMAEEGKDREDEVTPGEKEVGCCVV